MNTMIERDVVLQGRTSDGEDTIDLPITRLGNLEDTAEIKANPASEDFIPIIDTSDGGQMKKAPFSTTQARIDDELSSESDNPVQNKVIHTALKDKANAVHTHVASTITGLGELFQASGTIPVSDGGGWYGTSDTFSLNLIPGTYIVIALCHFNAEGSGVVEARFHNNHMSRMSTPLVEGIPVSLRLVDVMELDTAAQIYLDLHHTASITSSDEISNITAIRIK